MVTQAAVCESSNGQAPFVTEAPAKWLPGSPAMAMAMLIRNLRALWYTGSDK